MKRINITKKALLSVVVWTIAYGATAQVGVGTTNPDASAALEVKSSVKGFLPPRMTQTEIIAITSPAEGLMVYCTDCTTKGIYVYDGEKFKNCAGTATLIGPVTGAGGAVWLDRNLGASLVATSSSDALAYGDLYQWGRNTDGHQLRTSSLAAGPVTSGSEGNTFITGSGDWLTTQDDARWNGTTKGTHDPCPSGYRVPTVAEWDTEIAAWSSNDLSGGFASSLKLTGAGSRSTAGTVSSSVVGVYWTSIGAGLNGSLKNIPSSGSEGTFVLDKARGASVRCIKE